jgi:hypothetical protein
MTFFSGIWVGVDRERHQRTSEIRDHRLDEEIKVESRKVSLS